MPTGIYVRTKEMKTGKHMLGRKIPREVVEKIRIANTGDKNWRWGKYNVDASYRAIHAWIVSRRGQPTKCEHCGKDDLNERKIGWANKDHKYKRREGDWMRLCTVCHRRMDNNNWLWKDGQWYRNCNKCNALLSKKEYYIRKNGVWITPCKNCLSKNAKQKLRKLKRNK